MYDVNLTIAYRYSYKKVAIFAYLSQNFTLFKHEGWKFNRKLINVYDLIRACILEKNPKNLSMYTRLLDRGE